MDIAIESEAQVIENFNYFPSTVYRTDASQYLNVVKEVALSTITANENNINELYPVKMSGNIYGDERISDFCQNVIQFAWNILDGQGYNLENLQTYYQAMWMQEHYHSSGMEKHIHANGTQLVGFYFLEVPENSSKLILHDPRPSKIQIDLDEKNVEEITLATQMINFQPKAGELYFTNAWLPHSFSRNGSDKPLRFIHISVGLQHIPSTCSIPTII
jgi:hypothetical protein